MFTLVHCDSCRFIAEVTGCSIHLSALISRKNQLDIAGAPLPPRIQSLICQESKFHVPALSSVGATDLRDILM